MTIDWAELLMVSHFKGLSKGTFLPGTSSFLRNWTGTSSFLKERGTEWQFLGSPVPFAVPFFINCWAHIPFKDFNPKKLCNLLYYILAWLLMHMRNLLFRTFDIFFWLFKTLYPRPEKWNHFYKRYAFACQFCLVCSTPLPKNSFIHDPRKQLEMRNWRWN